MNDKIAQSNDDTAAKGLTRRGFGKLLGGGVAASVVGIGGPSAINKLLSQEYDIALLKKDADSDALGLVHRRCSATTDKATVEKMTKSDTVTGADSLTFSPVDNAPELLVVSPELYFAPGKEKSVHTVSLKGSPSNIYIPYHLFAEAATLDVRIKNKTNPSDPGHPIPRLCIEIVGPPVQSSLPVMPWLHQAIKDTVHASTTGTSSIFERGSAMAQDAWDWATGKADGSHQLALDQKQQQEAAAYEQAKPHPYQQTIFEIEMDYTRGHVPNLYFFNGRTLDNPTYCTPGKTLEHVMLNPSTREYGKCFRFMPTTQRGMVCNFVGDKKTDGCNMEYQSSDKFIDPDLKQRVDAAEQFKHGAPKQGWIPAAISYVSKKALVDDGLTPFELGAVNLAARTEQAVQREVENSGIGGALLGSYRIAAQRLGMGTPDTKSTPKAVTAR